MPLLEGIVYHGPTVDEVNDAGAQALVVEGGVLVGLVYMWFLVFALPVSQRCSATASLPKAAKQGGARTGCKVREGGNMHVQQPDNNT